ncbi:MAG TPA: cytochrome c oxidase subunit 3 [Acidimicrobiales bacterium]|nr:cytochrome c oxidase subunit 3 [Acidimicrobiales bacterium]
MTAVAALESGQAPTRQGPDALTVAAYIGGGALLIASLALLAGFYNLRDVATSWPPKGVDFDAYLSVMLSITLLLSGGVVAWGANAATAGNRRQALASLAITGGLGLSFLNLAWYTGSHAGFGPSSHAFGAIVIAGLVLGSVAVAVGLGFLAVAMLRTQFRAGEAHFVAAAARFWFLVIAAWMVSPVALYGLMSAK